MCKGASIEAIDRYTKMENGNNETNRRKTEWGKNKIGIRLGKTEQSTNKFSICEGSGILEMKLSIPFSSGEIVERTKESCQQCGKGGCFHGYQ
jgi:hypothetical protein